MQGAVKTLGIERRNWAALESGQKMVDSFDYQCCLPVLKQLSIFNSSTFTKANSSLIIVFWRRDSLYFWRREKRSHLCSGRDWETSL